MIQWLTNNVVIILFSSLPESLVLLERNRLREWAWAAGERVMLQSLPSSEESTSFTSIVGGSVGASGWWRGPLWSTWWGLAGVGFRPAGFCVAPVVYPFKLSPATLLPTLLVYWLFCMEYTPTGLVVNGPDSPLLAVFILRAAYMYRQRRGEMNKRPWNLIVICSVIR